MTQEMDEKMKPLIRTIIKNIKKKDAKSKKIVHAAKTELAERLILAFHPGPTADVHVVSNPVGFCGANIDFNKKRWVGVRFMM